MTCNECGGKGIRVADVSGASEPGTLVEGFREPPVLHGHAYMALDNGHLKLVSIPLSIALCSCIRQELRAASDATDGQGWGR